MPPPNRPPPKRWASAAKAATRTIAEITPRRALIRLSTFYRRLGRVEAEEECPQEWGHGSLKGYATLRIRSGLMSNPGRRVCRWNRRSDPSARPYDPSYRGRDCTWEFPCDRPRGVQT